VLRRSKRFSLSSFKRFCDEFEELLEELLELLLELRFLVPAAATPAVPVFGAATGAVAGVGAGALAVAALRLPSSEESPKEITDLLLLTHPQLLHSLRSSLFGSSQRGQTHFSFGLGLGCWQLLHTVLSPLLGSSQAGQTQRSGGATGAERAAPQLLH